MTPDGTAKILDFGLAKTSDGSIALPNVTTMTGAPRQWRAWSSAHGRTVTGTGAGAASRSPHGPLVARCGALRDGDAEQAVQRRNATTDPVRVVQKPAPSAIGAPQDLERIIGRCLAKDPAERYQSAATLVRDLDACATRMQNAERGFRALVARAKRPRVAVPALLAFAAAVALGGWALHASSMRRWAREEALPRARVLADQGSYVEAYQLAAAAEHYIPTDPTLRDLWPDLSRGFSMTRRRTVQTRSGSPTPISTRRGKHWGRHRFGIIACRSDPSGSVSRRRGICRSKSQRRPPPVAPRFSPKAARWLIWCVCRRSRSTRNTVASAVSAHGSPSTSSIGTK